MFERLHIAFVEDDPAVRNSVTETLELADFPVRPFDNAERALASIGRDFPGIVISDVRLPKMSGFDLLKRIKAIDASIPVVIVTGHGDISMAVQAMRDGAYDFLEKPYTMQKLLASAKRALEQRALHFEASALRSQLQGKVSLESRLLGNSVAMREVRRQINNLADSSADIMLYGETGTGKEVVARCLHEHSERSAGNFVAINCGGLPEHLFESEIFGHEQGAFTQASRRRIGKIEHADGGTLLLDEIESMPMAMQVKLLRVLQERKVERLGSNELVEVDFRVIAATKCDLGELSARGLFRSDLYHRLNVAQLHLPALRQRRGDIPTLFEHFLRQAAERYSRAVPRLGPTLVRRLMTGDWPGNVRELRNIADRVVLGLHMVDDISAHDNRSDAPPLTLSAQMELIEKSLIEQTLKKFNGRPLCVCAALDIGKKTLYDKLHRHGIAIENFRTPASKRSTGASTGPAQQA